MVREALGSAVPQSPAREDLGSPTLSIKAMAVLSPLTYSYAEYGLYAIELPLLPGVARAPGHAPRPSAANQHQPP
jgi:hypothetical protein